MTNAPCLESLGTKSGRSGGNHPENVSELRELWKYVQQKINTEHGTIYQIFDWLVLKKMIIKTFIQYLQFVLP